MQCDQESQDSVLVQRLICSVALNKSLPFPGFQAAVLILVFHHQSGDNTPDLRSNASMSYRKHQASDTCAGETLQNRVSLPALCSYRQGLGWGLDHLILRSYSSRGFLPAIHGPRILNTLWAGGGRSVSYQLCDFGHPSPFLRVVLTPACKDQSHRILVEIL